ncbi:CRISPR-associated RAMP-motif protein, Csm3 [Acidianus hospitalis W1]|uniref:CRISPR-associated RAMP-motif protein, Csm3 n=1 Tax=Acidianus hospitalis (strain W1) TaxID=933801 RepID=F4B5P3_ACIHW|nr:RAMP superfamily CRISPR-associated protein [Acidianus hospitalis]AEE93258.1 CRISPR-associated RAMP-motif protein, Csm3 [Acidianus hospitalis W1]
MGFLHSSLKYKRIVTFEIEPEEFLHIGDTKGLQIGGADLPIIKIGNKPIIPGSSLKGAIRNEFSRTVSGLSENKLKQLFGYTKLFTDNIQDILKEQDTRQIAEMIKNSLNGKDSKIGLLDLLFGSEIFASPTIFTDGLPVTQTEEYVTDRYHVRIDQDRDVAKKGNLVDVEAVYPKIKFEFKIIYNSLNYNTTDPSPVDKAFDYLVKFLDKSEILLGGWKSRGYGLVKLTKKNDETINLDNLLVIR